MANDPHDWKRILIMGLIVGMAVGLSVAYGTW